MKLGIRREDKSEWEARVPLTPENVRKLIELHGIEITVQPSPIRVFPDEAYTAAGARISECLSECPVVVAVKEIPEVLLEENKTYVFFAHVIKGQEYNMPRLRRMMELGCQLIDYEKIEDDQGRRLIFFGRHAGLAGMIDSLWAFGQRLAAEGMDTPFAKIRPAHQYSHSDDAKKHIAEIGREFGRTNIPTSLHPLVCGFAGYGNVSRGAQEIYDQLPVREIAPGELSGLASAGHESGNTLYKVVFKEEHLVQPMASGGVFQLREYYDHPERYHSQFRPFLEHLTLLVNCIYWEPRYPRLVTIDHLRSMFSGGPQPRLRVIGDITCDIGGSVECNLRATDSGNPVYVYDPATGQASDGVAGPGPVVLAVDNLPCELAAESSAAFGEVLTDLLPEIVRADYSAGLEACALPAPIRRAMVLYHGKLTPEYEYLRKYI